MSIPSKVTGGGNNSTARNVLRLSFSEALSAQPEYHMWDNGSTYPAVDAVGATTVKEAFVGTDGNGDRPEYALVDTSSAAPVADWLPDEATPGAANPNRMKGDSSYVVSPITPTAGQAIRFNITGEFASDSSVPSTSQQNILLEIDYQYTGPAPTLAYAYNDGSEGSPNWVAFTPGSHGIRLVNTGISGAPYKLTLPLSGKVVAEELWVTAN